MVKITNEEKTQLLKLLEDIELHRGNDEEHDLGYVLFKQLDRVCENKDTNKLLIAWSMLGQELLKVHDGFVESL